MKCSAFLLLLFCYIQSAAQFTLAGEDYDVYIGGENGLYGNGLSAYDFNGDGLEDLTSCTRNNGLRTFQNTGNGYQEVYFLPYVDGDIKHILWVDYDNDGDADVFVSIAGGSVRLFRHDDNWVFTDITSDLPLPSYAAITYGASWGDYDRDGLLDVYICNYEYNIENPNHNWLLHQYAPGQFEEVSVALGVDNGYRASFQSVWTDVNMDGYPDLYVINDRLHGNTLYVQENGVFVDQSDWYQLGLEMESMCNSWADYDGDLDLDVYVSNSDEGNKLMRNDGLFFTDVSEETQTEVNSICWASIWMDYDHNGKTDLHVATSADYYLDNYNALLTNTGDGIFSQSFIQGDNHTVLCEVQSDFNNDGYWDIVQMEQFPTDVQFFRNEGGSKHWLKYALQGQSSNRDGIGACVYAYSNGQASMQMKFCGESYLVQRSQYEIISLNDAETLDSIYIIWPSGWVDRFYELDADTLYFFTEGQSILPQENIVRKCPGEEVELIASEGTGYVWSGGENSGSVTTSLPGLYSVQYLNAYALEIEEYFLVEDQHEPSFTLEINPPACAGDTDGYIEVISNDEITISQASAGYWQENSISMLAAGWVEFTVTDSMFCSWQEEVFLDSIEQIQVMLNASPVCTGSSEELNPVISGGHAPYEILIDEESSAIVGAGEHLLQVTDAEGCYHDTLFFVNTWPEIVVELAVHDTCPGYPVSAEVSLSGGSGELFWYSDAENMEDLDPGVYTVYASDNAGCLVEESFFVEENPAPEFEWLVSYSEEEGCYQIEAIINDPELYIFSWSNGTEGAFVSCAEEGSWHCVITDVNGCTFFEEILVTGLKEEMHLPLNIYPNPCDDYVLVTNRENCDCAIYSSEGSLIKNVAASHGQFTLDTSFLPSGVYFIRCGYSVVAVIRN